MFRLARPFRSLCIAANARNLLNSSSQRANTPHILPFNFTTKRASAPQARALSVSAAASQNAPLRLAFNLSRAASDAWSFKGLASVSALAGLGVAAFQSQRPVVSCEEAPLPGAGTATSPLRTDPNPNEPAALPPPPRSSLNALELGFGTVAGICTGVFIKKGAKALAFTLGGVFVLLQYLASLRFVRVNWSSAESQFQADFPPRATFIAGMALGLRIG